MRTWNIASANGKILPASLALSCVLIAASPLLMAGPAAAKSSAGAYASADTASLKTKRAKRRSPGRRLVAPTTGYNIGLNQLAHTAKVFMKRGSCGLDCGIHKLASKGNLNLPVRAFLSCPSGKTVDFLKVNAVSVSGKTTKQSVSKKVNIKPWTAKDFEKACQQAFGGGWPLPGYPKVNKKTVYTTMTRNAKVHGRCSGWANTIYKTVKLKLKVTCVDRSYIRRAR